MKGHVNFLKKFHTNETYEILFHIFIPRMDTYEWFVQMPE